MVITAPPDEPAATRGSMYFGFPERFNRYYTDENYTSSATIFVSPSGGGDGATAATPTTPSEALAQSAPGTHIQFAAGTYDGCYELDDSHSGTYEAPIVLSGTRGATGEFLTVINCCGSGRQTCINLEGANYVAVDGFELVGGNYGVRAVGAGYPADQHQRGIAVLNNVGHGQDRDPFFTGQSDWYVIENNVAYDAGSGDGHGIYLSNGSDWMIVRGNETFNNVSSDFQINADPASTCADDGVAYNDVECDAVAGSHATGGRGASDFVLVENNFFHHGLAQGANFTSVRRSLVRNNIFAIYARHGVSFWQETDNPLLGARDNVVVHNLFVTSAANRQAVQFVVDSTGNTFANNVLAAVSISGGAVMGAGSGLLMEVDTTTATANTFTQNVYITGSLDGRTPNATEQVLTTLDAAWFADFPVMLTRDANTFRPSAAAPWLGQASRLSQATTDRDGTARTMATDPGPWEIP